MKVKNMIDTTRMVCKDLGENIIGIQGEQGNNGYNFHDADCSDIAYIVNKENEMNIYNYFRNTDVKAGITGPMGPVGPSGPILEPPTETYLLACIDRSRYGGQAVPITTTGYTLPLKMNLNGGFSYNTDSDSNCIEYYVQKSGYYEISYQVCLKDAAKIGTRILRDGSKIDGLSVEPENAETEYKASIIKRLYYTDRISLELYSDSDQSVTLKDGGTYLTMKLLRNW